MKIDRTSSPNTAPLRRKDPASGASGSGFTDALKGSDAAGSAEVGAGGVVGGLDALLALQEVPDQQSGRAKARQHGQRLLDLLDELRVNLLEGRVPDAALSHLAEEADRARAQTDDPHLDGILDEIELRARVELAKLAR